MKATRRTLLFLCFVLILPASFSAIARNMFGPDAYYDSNLDVLLRGQGINEQIYNPNNDKWYDYDVNLQMHGNLQTYQLHKQSPAKVSDILNQLSSEQSVNGGVQPNVSQQADQRRDAEQYNASFRAQNGMDPLPNQTQIPPPGVPMDPYASKGGTNGECVVNGRGALCPNGVPPGSNITTPQ